MKFYADTKDLKKSLHKYDPKGDVIQQIIDGWERVNIDNQRWALEVILDGEQLTNLNVAGIYKKMEVVHWVAVSDISTFYDWEHKNRAEIAIRCYTAHKSLEELENYMDFVGTAQRNLTLLWLLDCDNPILREWTFKVLIDGTYSFGNQFYMNPFSKRLSTLIEQGTYKKEIFTRLTEALKSTNTHILGVLDLLFKKGLLLKDCLKENKFFSVDLYKITNDSDFLPEQLKKIFLIKDKK